MSNINKLVQLNESFDWKNTTLYVHKLVKGNPYLNEQLDELIDLKIIDSKNEVYIYSFVHPDAEFCMSLCTGRLITSSFETNAWLSYVDPTKLMINKRIVANGFSLEKIGEKSFSTTMFLSNGSNVTFNKIAELNTKIISTTIPIPVAVLFGLYNAFTIKIIDEKNKFPVRNIKFVGTKLMSLPQLFTKSNYMYVRKMIVS
jgi:hypothetical protein